MKKRRVIFITIIVSTAIIFALAAIFVAFFGKEIIEKRLEVSLKMKVSIESVSLNFPFIVNIDNLKAGDFFRAGKISFSPNILGIVTGKIILDRLKIVEPVINLEQSRDGKLNLPKTIKGGKQQQFFVTGVTLRQGIINFKDEKILPEGFIVSLGSINASISKVMLPPTSLKAKFDANAIILDKESKRLGTIGGRGWVDFGSKDMDGVFEIKGLEAVYFQPYYGSFISNKKLVSAKLDLGSQLKAQHNDLNIVSNLKLYGIVYASEEPAQEGSMPYLDLSKNALDLFTDRQGDLNLDFEIRTKLDHPAVTSEQLKKIILNAAVRNLANQPPEDVAEKISNTVKQFKDFGKEMESIFKKKNKE